MRIFLCSLAHARFECIDAAGEAAAPSRTSPAYPAAREPPPGQPSLSTTAAAEVVACRLRPASAS